jgi:hypothetical protein
MKQIRWWPHARERLAERGIDTKLVQAALEQPDQVILSGRQKVIHKRYHHPHRHKKEYLLRIFVEEHSEGQIIRTVYRTSKITKYWRDDL